MSAGRFGMGRAGIENGQAGRAADDINAADSRPGRPAAKGIKLRMPAPDAQMPGPQPPAKVNRRCRAHLRGGKTGGFGLPRVGPGVASPFHVLASSPCLVPGLIANKRRWARPRCPSAVRRRAKVVARRGKGTLDSQLPLGHRQVVQESTAGGQLGTPHRYLSARYGCLTHERCLGWKFAIESIPGGHPFHQPALPKCGAIVAAASSSRHDGQAPVLAGGWGDFVQDGPAGLRDECDCLASTGPQRGHVPPTLVAFVFGGWRRRGVHLHVSVPRSRGSGGPRSVFPDGRGPIPSVLSDLTRQVPTEGPSPAGGGRAMWLRGRRRVGNDRSCMQTLRELDSPDDAVPALGKPVALWRPYFAACLEWFFLAATTRRRVRPRGERTGIEAMTYEVQQWPSVPESEAGKRVGEGVTGERSGTRHGPRVTESELDGFQGP
ncbi:hypothetical protein Purlil1_7021 [Purpureocillium lilacinum]|uniref:Uncharacterized protein n=1 Tax=Purpureocillium lilacinum TaxID=33203 RepID=A0ABR0BWW4_PURLI|nr:hypothetical protein Purlil1_7021 [Purpureocillium lilacinum]